MRRVVEPILAGAFESRCSDEDIAYAHDLGLVALDPDGTPRIANRIYAEVVPRHLNHAVQATLPHKMAWYVDAAGALDVTGLLAAFQTFFREHSEHWVQRFKQYHEAGPQLLLLGARAGQPLRRVASPPCGRPAAARWGGVRVARPFRARHHASGRSNTPSPPVGGLRGPSPTDLALPGDRIAPPPPAPVTESGDRHE